MKSTSCSSKIEKDFHLRKIILSYPKNFLEIWLFSGTNVTIKMLVLDAPLAKNILENACLFQTKIPFVSNLTFDMLESVLYLLSVQINKMFDFDSDIISFTIFLRIIP